MVLSELLFDVGISNSTDTATPIELAYYNDFSWQHMKPCRSDFFTSLDYAYLDSADFKDGEVVGLEVTEFGLTIHVVAVYLDD